MLSSNLAQTLGGTKFINAKDMLLVTLGCATQVQLRCSTHTHTHKHTPPPHTHKHTHTHFFFYKNDLGLNEMYLFRLFEKAVGLYDPVCTAASIARYTPDGFETSEKD
jgi:hypothetical protein